MAQFRAVIQGDNGKAAASRLATKRQKMDVCIQSWQGQLNIVMWHAEGDRSRDEGDYVRITLGPHGDAVSEHCVTLYDGPCDGWRARLAMIATQITNRNIGSNL